MPGFGVRVTPKGAKTLILRVRVGGRAGRQKEKSFGQVSDKLTADQLDLMRSQALNDRVMMRGENHVNVEDMTFKDAVEAYLEHLRAQYKIPNSDVDNVHRWPSHPRAVAYSLRRCVNHPPRKNEPGYNYWKTHGKPYHAGLGHLRLMEVSDRQISSIINRIAEKSLSSARHVRTNLHTMFEYHHTRSRGQVFNVVKAVPAVVEERRIGILTGQEMIEFDFQMRAIMERGGKKAIQAAACRVMMWTGSRVEELLLLKWEDDGAFHTNYVDMLRRVLVFRKHKTGKGKLSDVEVILSDYAQDALSRLYENEYRKRNDLSDMVFYSSWSKTGHICPKTLNLFFKREIKNIYREFGWPGYKQTLTLYNLRHSFISYLLNERGADVYDVAQQVKHADIRTTIGYHSRNVKALEQLRDAIGRQVD